MLQKSPWEGTWWEVSHSSGRDSGKDPTEVLRSCPQDQQPAACQEEGDWGTEWVWFSYYLAQVGKPREAVSIS